MAVNTKNARRKAAPSTAVPSDAVLDSIGGTEAAGGIDLRELLEALRTSIDREQVTEQALGFGRELFRIALGRSTVDVHPKDPRFRDPAWQNQALFRRLGQAYMAFCNAVDGVQPNENVDWHTQERMHLAKDFITSLLAPTNLLFTNPAALKQAQKTRGLSLVRGARNFVHDLRYNGGMPSQVDRSGFELGRNLAASPGAVVFRSEKLEVLQYQPTTARVHERPLLVISPQINKFYFLDLAPGRSFVEYAVSQGIQVFVVSWKNPSEAEAHWNLDGYCAALIEAMDAVRKIAGTEDLNAFGFCAGGITLAATLSHLADIGDRRVNAVCFAVTMLDFSVPALIGALNYKPMLQTAVKRSRKRQMLGGKQLASVFAWLRPNDLVWNYWVNNYLMGKAPPAFDILAWNADSTNLPAALHKDFIDIFSSNAIVRPGAVKVLGSGVDLSRIKVDAFLTGAINDHLTPWKACYRTTQLLGGECTFVLSNAGHVASLINPPGGAKSKYWIGPHPPADPDAWLEAATSHPGSWWECWKDWMTERSGERVRAPRRLGNKRFPALDPAPGTYVF